MSGIAEAFIFVAKVFGFLGGTSGLTGFTKLAINLTRFAIVTAASNALTRPDLDRGKRGSGFQQRDQLVRSPTAPMNLVYGETYVGGVLVYANTRASHQNNAVFDVHYVVAHAAHECEDITDIYYDTDQLVETTNFTWGGAVTSHDKWGPVAGINSVELYQALGTASQTVNSELDTSYTEIDSNFRGRGICYTVHVFRFHDRNQQQFNAPPGNIRVKVKGKNNIYDPALDITPGASPDNASYQAWTDNPILCIADYMRNYLPRCGNDDIDWADVETEAAICDATVAIPTAATEARYTLNGIVSLGDTHRDNLERMLASCNGSLFKVDGKWQIKAGAYQAATVTLTDDDIIGDPVWVATTASGERFNTVHTQYISKDDDWLEVEGVEVQDASYLTRDNSVELVRTINLDYTDHETEAQRVATKLLNQGDQQGILTVPLKWTGLELTPLAGVDLTYAPFSFTNKTFRTLAMSIGGDDAPVVAVLREDTSAAWADPAEGAYVARASGSSISPAIPPPTNLAPSTDNLYAYFPLNTTTPVNAAPGSAVPNGTLGGSPGIAAGDVRGGRSYRFDNSAEHVILMADADADTLEAGAWTVSLWFRSLSVAGDANARIITRDASDYWAILIDQSAAQGSQTINYYITGTIEATSIAIDDWNHVAITMDASGNWTFYHNARVVDTGSGYSPVASSRPIVLAVNTESTPGLSNPYDGLIDEVLFYTEELTASGIRGLFERGGFETPPMQLGDGSLVDESGNTLSDIDVRNDELVVDSLGSLIPNPTMSIQRRNPNGDLAPASWYRDNNASANVVYEDDTVRDVLKLDTTAQSSTRIVSGAFRVEPGTQYEAVMYIKDANGASSVVDWTINELDGDLSDGEYGVGSGTNGETQLATRNRGQSSQLSLSLTTSYQVFKLDYEPSSSSVKWASVSIHGQGRDIRVDWCLVRESTSYYVPSVVHKTSVQLTNPSFEYLMRSDVTRPAGWWVGNNTDGLSYDDDARTQMFISGSRAACSNAFRINPDALYVIRARVKGTTTMTGGLQLGVEELDSELSTDTKDFVRTNASGESNGETRTRFKASSLTSGNVTTSFQVFEGDYVPTSTALWGSVRLYDNTVSGSLIVDWVEIIEQAPITANPGGVAHSWTTYEASGWSPTSTTQDTEVKFNRNGNEVASITVRSTVTQSGANEGDIAVTENASSGEDTTLTINSGNNTNNVSWTVKHDDSGVEVDGASVSVNAYSGGPGK